MLRASIDETGGQVDAAALVDDDRDLLIAGGNALRDFTKALVRRRDDLDARRAALVDELGPAAAAKAATVAGNFEMMNRLLDAGGVPIPAPQWSFADDLGLDVGEIKAAHPRLA